MMPHCAGRFPAAVFARLPRYSLPKAATRSCRLQLTVDKNQHTAIISVMQSQFVTDIINKCYPEDNELRRLLLRHSRDVADRALAIVKKHPELGARTPIC